MAGRGGTMTSMKSWGTIAGSSTPEAMALWVLVVLEVLAQIGLRRYFKKNHGG